MDKKQLSVLFILPEYYPHSGGGISTYYLHYIKALKSELTEIKVMVGSGYTQSDDTFNIDGITIEYLKPAIYQTYITKFSKFDLTPEYRNNLAAAWAIWDQCKEGIDYDIIECTDFGLGFAPWLIHHKKPVITRLHGSSGQIDLFESDYKIGLTADLYRQTELLLLKKSDVLISHSLANKIYWENILSQREVKLIYPIFENLQHFTPFKEKENYGIVCGRIQNWKGPDVLCKALTHLSNSNITIKWFGKDTLFNNKITKGDQLSKDYPNVWNKMIKPHKALPNNEIIYIQKQARFAIIPSTWDMFNFTGLEYLDAGTVLICSDGAGVSELIENGVNGYKYNKDNDLELANCILVVSNLEESSYKEIVENGKKTLIEKLNPEQIITSNISIYKALIHSFTQSGNNIFINELFKPSDKQYRIDFTLDTIRLKTLLKYISLRWFKKLFSSLNI